MIKKANAYIASFAVAPGPYVADQSFAEEFMKKHYGSKLSPRSLSLMHTLFSHPSIKKRHFAVDSPEELVDEHPDAKISRFTKWAIELSSRAASEAMSDAGISLGDVSGIVVNTCTGYVCPGLSTYLIERLGLSPRVKAYDLVGSGCGGAIPNLDLAESVLTKNGRGAVLSVSVEICSATLQVENDISLILSNALFGDGAAAAVLWMRPVGYEMVASASRYVPEQRDAIRYVHKNGQLHNRLSLKLPELVGKTAAQVAKEVLEQAAVEKAAVAHWAIHTGGEKIINAVRDELGLSEKDVAPSRKVLEEYGNMSSPTVWFVLREVERRGVLPADYVAMLAYGAGLSAHGFLLKKSSLFAV